MGVRERSARDCREKGGRRVEERGAGGGGGGGCERLVGWL